MLRRMILSLLLRLCLAIRILLRIHALTQRFPDNFNQEHTPWHTPETICSRIIPTRTFPLEKFPPRAIPFWRGGSCLGVIVMDGNCPRQIILFGNCPSKNCPGNAVPGRIARGNYPGGNCPLGVGGCSVTYRNLADRHSYARDTNFKECASLSTLRQIAAGHVWS